MNTFKKVELNSFKILKSKNLYCIDVLMIFVIRKEVFKQKIHNFIIDER